mmetsp:Transcript_60757/g.168431  ORF Transcript_60757/g.168431 Transcript_60757/m.168431 type:complete len:312 (+) Transcript_60757:672-1607(+)
MALSLGGGVTALEAASFADKSPATRWKSALRPACARSERASALATSASTWLRSSPESLCRREDSSTRRPASISPTRRANQAPTSMSPASGPSDGNVVALPRSVVDPLQGEVSLASSGRTPTSKRCLWSCGGSPFAQAPSTRSKRSTCATTSAAKASSRACTASSAGSSEGLHAGAGSWPPHTAGCGGAGGPAASRRRSTASRRACNAAVSCLCWSWLLTSMSSASVWERCSSSMDAACISCLSHRAAKSPRSPLRDVSSAQIRERLSSTLDLRKLSSSSCWLERRSSSLRRPCNSTAEKAARIAGEPPSRC